jgi:hypothetical protein
MSAQRHNQPRNHANEHGALGSASTAVNQAAAQSNEVRDSAARAERPARVSPPSKGLITPARVIFVITVALLIIGYQFPTERYISAATGVGYILGIVGGSLMLILLLYPLRKRYRWLAFMGSTKRWFQVHMLLGIAGPVMILYHSNFSLGATNSNVALICMLIVSGSGLFGRHFYSRIHDGLYGSKASIVELQQQAQRLRNLASGGALLPEVVKCIDAEEANITRRCGNTTVLLRPPVAWWHTLRARVRLYRHVRKVLRGKRQLSSEQQQRFYQMASTYIDHRLGATRRVVEFDAYERLFSLWHMLHMPLFFMLVIAGIVHVIAVHIY